MSWQVYLSGEIHTDWRDRVEDAARDAGVVGRGVVRAGRRRSHRRLPGRARRSRRGARARRGHGPDRAAARAARRGRPWHRPVVRHGRPDAGEAGRRGRRGHARRLRHHAGPRPLLPRLPRDQHDHEPDHPGRAGRVLRERRRAPGDRRLLRGRVNVPGLRRLPPGERFQAFDVSPARLGFDEYDVAAQGLVSHHYRVTGGRLDVVSVPFRYVWPSELDLMARLAGMTLRERWGGWRGEPFTSESTLHVSVWEEPEG